MDTYIVTITTTLAIQADDADHADQLAEDWAVLGYNELGAVCAIQIRTIKVTDHASTGGEA